MIGMLRKLVLSVVLAGLALTQAGCLLAAAAGATAGGVMYVKGDTEATVAATPREATRAATEAAQELDLVIVSSTSSEIDGKVTARTASDAKVVIVAKALGDRATHLSIRTGNFGDDILQHNLLKRIRAKLEPSTESAAVD